MHSRHYTGNSLHPKDNECYCVSEDPDLLNKEKHAAEYLSKEWPAVKTPMHFFKDKDWIPTESQVSVVFFGTYCVITIQFTFKSVL